MSRMQCSDIVDDHFELELFGDFRSFPDTLRRRPGYTVYILLCALRKIEFGKGRLVACY